MAAATSRPYGYLFDAVDEAISEADGPYLITKMILTTGANAGTFSWEHADASTVILDGLYLATNSTLVIDYPFGNRGIRSLNLGGLPTGGQAQVILG